MGSEPIDLRELGARLREYRRKRNLSVRAAAVESGAPFNTISRVERGQMPDLMNFKRIAEWIGLDPALFFQPPRMRRQSTTEIIRYHLRQDPCLTEQDADRIAGIVDGLYGTLASSPESAVAHIHVADTFAPGVATKLGELVTTMRDNLAADDTIGHAPGWTD